MQSRVASSLVAITSLFLFFASNLVVAQINVPGCESGYLWEWSFNSLGQNPCEVAGYMMGTCYGGSNTFEISRVHCPVSSPPTEFVIDPLGMSTLNSYAVPSETNGTESCWCNFVAFNLYGGCNECQGGPRVPLLWEDYSINCRNIGRTLPGFPNPVPPGTRVPQWALLVVNTTFVDNGYWSSRTAETVGDYPEISPGAVIQTAAPLPSTASGSSTGTSSGSRSNKGAIAGGAIRGVTTIAAIAGLVTWLVLSPIS
ncbi:hypothetical protein EDB87DRAFT_1643957 [Lactarius vividus]|nr:hypothetical protein EDB87DRAFT_1643957 [Lactarius vividus]